MNLKLFLLATVLVSTGIGYAQDIQPSQNLVLYDPLFWKDQLKLDAFQCRKIKEINSSYYDKLSAVIREVPDGNALQVKAAQSLLQRSESIWETFYPKQRKRWKKIWQESSPRLRTNET